MVPREPSSPGQRARYEPLFELDPQTGVSIEVFFADRALDTFGMCGAGWFWQARQRGFAPEGSPVGPYPTTYAAYRSAITRQRFRNDV